MSNNLLRTTAVLPPDTVWNKAHQLRQYLVLHYCLCQIITVVRQAPTGQCCRLLDAASARSDEGETEESDTPAITLPTAHSCSSTERFNMQFCVRSMLFKCCSPRHMVQQKRPQQCHCSCLLQSLYVLWTLCHLCHSCDKGYTLLLVALESLQHGPGRHGVFCCSLYSLLCRVLLPRD